MPPTIKPHLHRSRSHTTTASTQPSRSATDPLTPVTTTTSRTSTGPEPAGRGPRAALTLPSLSSPEKEKARNQIKEKVEKHHRLGLHTHFPHPHLHHPFSGLHESSHHRSRSHDNRHRHAQIDNQAQTPTILVNDATRDVDKSEEKWHHPHSQHHLHLHIPSNNNSSTALRRMNSSRSYTRPRAVSDSTRPHSLHGSPTTSGSRPQLTTRTTTTAQLIGFAVDDAEARKKARLAGATKEDLAKLRRAAREAEHELRGRLNETSRTSTEITRRLDYTYYNLLEKVGQLVATVTSFKSLLNQTEAVRASFAESISSESHSGGLQADVDRSLDDFRKGFELREKRIVELEERLRGGSLKAAELGQRLEACRKTVEKWEEREREWKEKIDWRLRFCWICGAILIIVSVITAIWWENGVVREHNMQDLKGRENKTLQVAVRGEGDLMKRLDAVPENVQDIVKSAVVQGSSKRASTPTMVSSPLAPEQLTRGSRSGEDDRLRLFDEL